MHFIALTVLTLWLPICLLISRDIRGARGVITAYVVGWLFLPNIAITFLGFPDYNKTSATSLGVLVGTLLFDRGRLLNLRPHWVDLPMICFCAAPMGSSLANGLGFFDGLSEVLSRAVMWGLPYVLGRAFFTDWASLTTLARGIFYGGLLYIPFCLYEVRMSPQLHFMLYGSYGRHWNAMRFGGWRPTVFLDTGLAVGMWMTAASLIGFWLWRHRLVSRLVVLPAGLCWPMLLVTTVLCKATGALLLLAGGLAVLVATRRLRSPVLIAALVSVAPAYVVLRSTELYDGRHIVLLARHLIDEQRAQSLAFRFENENLLVQKALQRPFWGWGGWNRYQIQDEFGETLTIPDGLWVQVLGRNGLAGLVSLLAVTAVAPCILLIRLRRDEWGSSEYAAPVALTVFVLLYSVDNLLNAMENPVFVLIMGAVNGWVTWSASARGSEVQRPWRRPQGVLPAPLRQLWPRWRESLP